MTGFSFTAAGKLLFASWSQKEVGRRLRHITKQFLMLELNLVIFSIPSWMEKAILETQELSFIHILKSSWNAIRPNDISLGMPETLFEFFI